MIESTEFCTTRYDQFISNDSNPLYHWCRKERNHYSSGHKCPCGFTWDKEEVAHGR